MARPLLERLRHEGEQLLRELASAELANLQGLRVEAPLEAAYERRPELSRAETFHELGELARGEPGSRLAAERFRELVGTSVERRAAAPARARRLEAEATAVLPVAGLRIPYRALAGAIAESADPARRRALETALVDGTRELEGLVREELSRSRDAAAALGGEDYPAHRSALQGFEADEVAGQAERVLAETEDMGREAVARLLAGHVEDLAGARLSDLWRGARAPGLDRSLPREELGRIDSFLSRLGLEPSGRGRIVRDLENRPAKAARGGTVALRVPDHVVVVLRPGAGLPGFRALLHELGRALHLAGTDPARPLEQARLGDGSVGEGWARLLEGLLANPVFGRRALGLSGPDSELVAGTAAAAILTTTRREAARVLCELSVHRGEAQVADLYGELQRRAAFVEVPRELWAADLAPELGSARRLRGALFEAAAHEVLRDRFDEDWFLNPRAGAFVEALFAEGQARDLHVLVREELGRGLEVEALRGRFEEVL